MSIRAVIYLIVPTLFFSLFGYVIIDSKFVAPEFIEEPVQGNLVESETIYIEGDEGMVELELLATYSINAIVKSVEDYTTDYTSQISPRDFALAWGDINNPLIDEFVSYSQKERWYYFTVNSRAPVSVDYVDFYSANTHIIPANEEVEALIADVEVNDYITMKGYLVNAYFENGYWKSSLVREDTGNGSCEIMYVTEITINGN